MNTHLFMINGNMKLQILTLFVLIVIFFYLICFFISIIKKLKNKKYQKLSVLGSNDNSVFIYIGVKLVKYISENNPYNLQTRIQKLNDEYGHEKGYIYKTPSIIVDDNLKPNEVLIKDFDNEGNKVYFEVFEDYVFSFEKLDYKGIFSKNYPIFYKPVYFYKKDNVSVCPVRIFNNTFDDITPQTQIVDLIASIYKEIAFRNSFCPSDDYFFLFDDNAFSDYCKNNLIEDYMKNEYFLNFARDIVEKYIYFEQELPPVEDILSIAKSFVELYSKGDDFDFVQEVINYKQNKNFFLSNLLDNGKLYVYTLEQNFIDSFRYYLSGECPEDLRFDEFLIDRIEKSIVPNSKFVILCDDNYRAYLDDLIKNYFVFSKVLSFNILPSDINYEIIGTIK